MQIMLVPCYMQVSMIVILILLSWMFVTNEIMLVLCESLDKTSEYVVYEFVT